MMFLQRKKDIRSHYKFLNRVRFIVNICCTINLSVFCAFITILLTVIIKSTGTTSGVSLSWPARAKPQPYNSKHILT